jgi:hypothetical protein
MLDLLRGHAAMKLVNAALLEALAELRLEDV